jgi:hypothetical protein
MISPLMLQVAVAALAFFSIAGVAVAVLYPGLFGASRGEKRLEAIGATKRRAALPSAGPRPTGSPPKRAVAGAASRIR